MENITVMLIDIDRFKSIKDNFGHHTGDFIIKELSKRLQTCIGDNDLLIKDRGEEFIIFLTEVNNDKSEMMKVVNNIKNQFALPFFFKGEQINVFASIGVSTSKVEKHEDNNLDMFIDRIIRQADTAMYHAKKYGRNTHCFNTADQNKELERYYLLEQEIKIALNRGQFFTFYHPLVNLKNNKMIGVEALLRWFNPRLGFVTPVEFIPILEETGLIIPVGKSVIKSVCQQMKCWHDQGIHMERVAVNVSPIQFRDPNFVNDVKETLEETGLDATYLEIEITEGTILNIQNPEKVLGELRDLGVSISIDDFGTGYSSLSYLKRLPINTIKIDKSFIDDLDENEEVIVNTIISLGKNLDFNVVAEGIENKAQLNYLKGQKCPEGQGYFWSKPVEAKKIKKIYQKQNATY